MPRQLTPHTSLDNLKREARRWLNDLEAGLQTARERLARTWPGAPDTPTLRDMQRALALEFGLPGWAALREALQARGPAQPTAARRFEESATALLAAYTTGDEAALRRVWEDNGHRRSLDATRRYIRVDLGLPEHDEVPISIEQARSLVARSNGFATWDALLVHVTAPQQGSLEATAAPVELHSRPEGHGHRRLARTRSWEEVLDLAGSLEADALEAHGQMTDAVLARVAALPGLTALGLSNSPRLTDAGLAVLAGMPQLRHLDLSGCPITDEALAVLRELPDLEMINLGGTRVTDAGVAYLAGCTRLRQVDLFHTATGDGAIRSLSGKPHLHEFKSGARVTDAGVEALRDWPVFHTWRGGRVDLGLTGFTPRPNSLLLRGPLTNRGIHLLAALGGCFGLNIDAPELGQLDIRPLVAMPHLGALAFDATDASMPVIASMPHLQYLTCQDTTATDAGFAALSASRTIQQIWGRRCHNLRARGFRALSTMPALRRLSVSCLNVDDSGLASLPDFPVLEEADADGRAG